MGSKQPLHLSTTIYNANGNRVSLTCSNGTVETYTYNLANWITGMENKKGSETLSSFAYTYYASGSQKSETDHTGKVIGYVYDGLGRLTEESETNGLTVNYTYDAAGNRSQMAFTGTETYTTVYTYDANNRLLTETKSENGETSSTIYDYDRNGNMVQKQTDDETTVYAYNRFNQLRKVTSGTETAEYAYNAQGIRTCKTVGKLRTAYLLDGGNVVAEVQNNTVTDNYLRGVNLIRRTSTDETEYYLFNAHGDVVTTTNQNGTINQEYDYDAFGNEKNPDALDTNPFRYCGEYLDAETGDYYLRARYYDPTIGRFTQQDTHWNTANMIYGDNPQKINEREDKLGLKTYSNSPQITAVIQSGNLYLYALNNPANYLDPSGNIAVVDDLVVAGLAIASLVGAYAATPVLLQLLNQMGKALADIYTMTKEQLEWLIERVGSEKTDEHVVTTSTSAIAAPAAPEPDDENGKQNRNWNKVKEKYLEKKLKELGTDPHKIKEEYLGKGAELKKYDIYVDKATGQLAIFEKSTGKLVEITYYFIK